MFNSLEHYLFIVGVRSLEYTHTEEDICNNINYFKGCQERGLSPYSALLFFHDFLIEKNINTFENGINP